MCAQQRGTDWEEQGWCTEEVGGGGGGGEAGAVGRRWWRGGVQKVRPTTLSQLALRRVQGRVSFSLQRLHLPLSVPPTSPHPHPPLPPTGTSPVPNFQTSASRAVAITTFCAILLRFLLKTDCNAYCECWRKRRMKTSPHVFRKETVCNDSVKNGLKRRGTKEK